MAIMHAGHLEEIEVKVSSLLEKLRANQTAHEALYKTLVEKYRERAQAALDQRMRQIERWMPELELPNMRFEIEPPDYYGPAYEQAIGMLEMHAEAGKETVMLTPELYRSYVLDHWSWTEQFSFKNTRMYGV
jgi:hypothetical protein